MIATMIPNIMPILAAGEATENAAHAMGRHVPPWAKGNVIFENFFLGGWIMWPIVIVLVVAVAVVIERLIWWIIEWKRKDAKLLDKIYGELEKGNLNAVDQIGKNSKDPLVRTACHGITHSHSSVEGALQVASGIEIDRAGRFMSVMDTIITLAPLLGLIGTVTGIMSAFNAVNEGGLSPAAVSGGIGEALIATAAGLGIAIFTLIFFNYFNAKLAKLQFELATTSNNVILMLNNLRAQRTHVENPLKPI